MYPKIRRLAILLTAAAFCCLPVRTTAQPVTSGRIAMGAFVPTGDDADVASASFALQLTADVEIQGRLAGEAEFSWVPINLESTGRPDGTLIEARQIGALAGLRLTSNKLSRESTAPVAYLSGRIGFSRIAVTSDTTASVPGWIGSAVDATQNLPPFSFPVRATENAFVISPRAGFIIRSKGSAIVDISVSTSFLFDQGQVSTQVFATVGFGLLGILD